MTEQATTEQATPEQATTEQAPTEQATTEQATTEQARTEQVKTGEQAAARQVPTEPATTEQVPTEQATTEQAAARQVPTGEQAAARPTEAEATAALTILGATVRHAVEHVECFPAPEHVTAVRFTTDELASVCPVTGQPDLSHVVIEYTPRRQCVESKSLKLYLWSFRDRAVFAEALAAEIAGEIMATAQPQSVTVTLTQRPRGGIEVQAVARLP